MVLTSFIFLAMDEGLSGRRHKPVGEWNRDTDSAEHLAQIRRLEDAFRMRTKCNFGEQPESVDNLMRKNDKTGPMKNVARLRLYDRYKTMHGLETYVFYPGHVGGTDNPQTGTTCDDITQDVCWRKARLLNDRAQDVDVSCLKEDRCLHVQWMSGDMAFPYTCPNWIRHPLLNLPCLKPNTGWQACPLAFTKMEPDESGGEVDLALWYEARRRNHECNNNVKEYCILSRAAAAKLLSEDGFSDPSPIPKRSGDESPKKLLEKIVKVKRESSNAASYLLTTAAALKERLKVGAPARMVFNVVRNEWLLCDTKMMCRPHPVTRVLPTTHADTKCHKCPEDALHFCLLSAEGNVCAHKDRIGVVVPYERDMLLQDSVQNPIKPGLLVDRTNFFL